jgi:capsular polysaccharide biosynthesis protein
MELLRRGWLIFKRRWLLLVVPLLIALATVFALDAFLPKHYTTSTTVFLRAPDVKTSASAYQGNLFTMQRVNTYVKMVQSDELAQLVVDRLGLDTTAHDLASHVEAAPIKDTVLLTISATADSPEESANIANTYGSEFATYVSAVEAVQLSADVPPLVTVVKPADAVDATSSMFSPRLMLGMAAGIGLVVGILLMWLAERYDTKIRSRRQVEELTNSEVIGSLPPERSLRSAETIEEAFGSSDEFADAARILAINAEHALREVSKVNGAAVLAVASVDVGDGKSVVASALVTAWSERGHRVGLVRVAPAGRSSQVDDGRLEKITTTKAGVQVGLVRANGALRERDIEVVIEELSKGSDFIVVDPDGSGASAEAQIAATLSDAVVVVARPGHTDENSLADLANAMTMLGTPVIGVVANYAKETHTGGRFYA